MHPLLQEFKNAPLVSYNNRQIISLKDAKKDACVYYLQYGYVKVYTISDAGDEHILLILHRHDVFPLSPLLAESGGGQKIFFEALGRVKLLQLKKADFTTAMETQLAISNAVLLQLRERFLTSCQHTENLLGKSAYEKLIYCLQFLAARYGHKDGRSVFLDTVFTHRLIASIIGLTRGTVTNEFEKLRLNNLVSTANGRITITSMSRLSKVFGSPFTVTP